MCRFLIPAGFALFFIGGGSVAIGFGYAVFRLYEMYN